MVVPVRPTLRERVRVLPAFLCFSTLGVLALWLALSSLLASIHALMSHAPLVALSPRDAIGMPLALLCFALAAMTLLPAPDTGGGRTRNRQRRPESRQSRGLTLCLTAAMAGVLLTVITAPLTELAASTIMANRSYLRCPAPLRERHPPLRWIRPDGRCP